VLTYFFNLSSDLIRNNTPYISYNNLFSNLREYLMEEHSNPISMARKCDSFTLAKHINPLVPEFSFKF
jgi:hypothetical protein